MKRSPIEVEHIVGGPSHGWVHTHGLAVLGLPELEIRGVPAFLGTAASRLLVDVANHLAHGQVDPLPGATLTLDRYPQMRLELLGPGAGYDADHYGDTRLCLVDASADDTTAATSLPAMPFARA